MVVASAWQAPHVRATRGGWTLEAGSDGGLIECAGWQLPHVATFGSASSRRRRPCTEVAYSATWSTRSAGLYCFMKRASEWQRPPPWATCCRAGLSIVHVSRALVL